MIAYINGDLTYITDEAVIVDIQGIGYEIICPNPYYFQQSLNKEVKIYTYHYVREDAQILYGFKNEEEKHLFTKLISVSGIGPKGALAILGSVDIPGFISAIEQEDDKFLTSFPGVGKKTARQMILDLKGKLTSMVTITNETDVSNDTDRVGAEDIKEAQEALKALGYTDREIKPILPELQKEQLGSTDEIIRKALSLLMKN
ncbi:Holliday junction branch migration protein RuvA [Ornithinibacillus salinisoli]|uniref:Holliday junction branch migration complex subunit RuvA n=1 Tax=Ornithinibacillus salinisoli TaxID=1848459 RepID=A0ABW4W349_9BACI